VKRDIYTSGEYLQQNPLYHTQHSAWKARHILRMLNKNKLKVVSVCEVGCGAGEILRQLQLQMPEETIFRGYDISPQAFELCKSRANKHLSFYCEDFLRADTEIFDLVLCVDVFEHVEDYMGFLRSLRSKATYKIFHIPLDMSVQTIFRLTPILQCRSTLGHLHYFMKETALLTLQDTGYEIKDYFFTSTGIDQGKTLKQRLLKLPRIAFRLVSPNLAARILGGFSLLVLAK
jgi:2-polyprenyl-3-methyl-5-hydroxy-6-metoxy-1,4-benzoquinol methylase